MCNYSTKQRGLAQAIWPLFCFLPAMLPYKAASAAVENPSVTVDRILLKSILAQGRINLRGRQVDLTPAKGETYNRTTKRVIRRSDGRCLSICLDSHDKPVSVHMDDGRITRDYDVHSRTITTAHSMPTVRTEVEAHRIARRILSNYRVRLVRSDSIASRPCFVLELDARDPQSHSLIVWIDKETGTTLSREENDRKGGSTLGLTLFTDVAFPGEIKDSDVQYKFPRSAKVTPLSLSPRFKDLQPLRPRAGFPLFQPISMPFGFEFESCEMVRFSGIPTACLRYSDGVAVINVFEAKARDPVPPSNAQITYRALPRGESLAMVQLDRTMCVVMGGRTVEGTVMIARSLDVEDARSKLNGLARTFNVPEPVLMNMRNQGCGLDCIAAILEISAQTRKTVQSVFWMHRQGWQWPSIAQQLRANVRTVSNRVKPYECR